MLSSAAQTEAQSQIRHFDLQLSCLSSSLCERVLERCRLQKSLSSSPKAQSSDVELSAESDSPVQADEERKEEEEDTERPGENKEEPVKEQDLEAQVSIRLSHSEHFQHPHFRA